MTTTFEKFKLSDDQEYILNNYEKGYASVLATPGAGKTTIISYLVKKFIQDLNVKPRQILILTLTESAAKEFKSRTLKLIGKVFPQPEFLTIHSFCKKILDTYDRRYSGLSVLGETEKYDFFENIISEKGLNSEDETQGNDDFDYISIFKDYIIPLFRKDPSLLENIKEYCETDPKISMQKTGISSSHFKYITYIPEIIEAYENFLRTEKKIDFDMMINETYNVLKSNFKILKNLRNKYCYILEDEAQDSNNIQGEILKLIAGENGNYIRVGDPNQSIFTTFTGADYKGLMEFYNQHQKMEIKQSNRSHISIIDAANFVVEKMKESFPSYHVKIQQGFNNPQKGEVVLEEFEEHQEEIKKIADNIDNFLKKERKITIAILTRTNKQAKSFYQELVKQGFPCILHGSKEDDFFNNPVVKKILHLVGFIIFPYQLERFQTLMKVLEVDEKILSEFFYEPEKYYETIKYLANNQILYSGDDSIEEKATVLCKNLYKLINSVYFSISEILQIINNLFIIDVKDKTIGAILHKMWVRSKPNHSNIGEFYAWMSKYLNIKISQELNFTEEDFSSPNIVHILTIHKAKGLQWDCVFLPNFNSWEFKDFSWKGAQEKKDVKSVILSLTQNIKRDLVRNEIKIDEVHESRRVAYVAITRAKKYLYLTVSANSENKKRDPAEIYLELRNYINSKNEN